MFCIVRDFGNRQEFLALVEDREQADILAGQLDMEYAPDEPGCIVVYQMIEVWRLS